jgi:hypothetical protein
MKGSRSKHGRSSETPSNRALVSAKAVRGAKHQENQCKVCSSSQRLKIERGYLDGDSERALAQIYGMSDSAIHRHVVATDLNRLRQTDAEIYYLRVINAAEKIIARDVTIRDGLRAAERLDKIRGAEKDPRKRRGDGERLKTMLEERIEFALEGFRRIGLTSGLENPMLLRRDVLELMAKTPESAGDLYSLIIDELSVLDQAAHGRKDR